MNVSVAEIKRQLARLRTSGFDRLLATSAAAHAFPAAYYYGIASRETNCRHILGDRRADGYHGVGIVQIDIQHDIARRMRDDGTWKTHPEQLIVFGAELLYHNIAAARHAFPTFTNRQHLKIAASGYNCGIARAIDGSHHGDSDHKTTGGDYGADVMGRTLAFSELTGEKVP